MTAPPLETPRLLLNAHTLADFEPMAAMWADPVVNRHIGPPATRYETWKRLLRYGGYWPLLGYGSWAVREKASCRFIGDAGFRGLWQAGHIATDGAVEAGWVLAAWAHGQGFGSEALSAVLAWLDTQSRLTRAVCLIHPANTASIRLATRHGFGAARTVLVKGNEALELTRPRP